MILVIGATGQLGFDVVRNLADMGRPVRALVRPGSPHADIDGIDGVEVATGDLADHDSIDRAVAGVEAIRFPMFTEVWLAITGSSIPERGEPRSPLKRDYPFLQRFRKMTGRMVEDRGRLMVTGPASNRRRSSRSTTSAGSWPPPWTIRRR